MNMKKIPIIGAIPPLKRQDGIKIIVSEMFHIIDDGEHPWLLDSGLAQTCKPVAMTWELILQSFSKSLK